MIEPTDEMRDVFLATQAFELNRGASEAHAVRRALTAVLAIVERDYRVSGRIQLHCGAAGPDGIVCQRGPGHWDRHAYAGDTGLVRW